MLYQDVDGAPGPPRQGQQVLGGHCPGPGHVRRPGEVVGGSARLKGAQARAHIAAVDGVAEAVP